MKMTVDGLMLRRTKARTLLRLCKVVLAANKRHDGRVYSIRALAGELGFVGDGAVAQYAQTCIDNCNREIMQIRKMAA